MATQQFRNSITVVVLGGPTRNGLLSNISTMTCCCDSRQDIREAFIAKHAGQSSLNTQQTDDHYDCFQSVRNNIDRVAFRKCVFPVVALLFALFWCIRCFTDPHFPSQFSFSAFVLSSCHHCFQFPSVKVVSLIFHQSHGMWIQQYLFFFFLISPHFYRCAPVSGNISYLTLSVRFMFSKSPSLWETTISELAAYTLKQAGYPITNLVTGIKLNKLAAFNFL